MLPRRNGGRIPCDVPDDALLLRGRDYFGMQLLRQLGFGKFGKRPGKL